MRIEAAEDINDRQVVIQHRRAGHATVLHHPQAGLRVVGDPQRQSQPLEQAPGGGCAQPGPALQPARIRQQRGPQRHHGATGGAKQQRIHVVGAAEGLAIPVKGLQHPIEGMARGEAAAKPATQHLGGLHRRQPVEQGQRLLRVGGGGEGWRPPRCGGLHGHEMPGFSGWHFIEKIIWVAGCCYICPACPWVNGRSNC